MTLNGVMAIILHYFSSFQCALRKTNKLKICVNILRQMNQDTTWYGGRGGLGPSDIVLDGDPAPPTQRGTAVEEVATCFPSAPPGKSLHKMHRTHILLKDVITTILFLLFYGNARHLKIKRKDFLNGPPRIFIPIF